MIFDDTDTIVAPATPAGGALCIVRMSGRRAIELCDGVFHGKRPLADAATATLHYGLIRDGEQTIDDVLVALFRAPHSYTGEDAVEISAHGSAYVVQRILALLISRGARPAEAGEFTRRAFLNGRMDLAQAEAVADMIASDSRASHAVASTQMRGTYSEELRSLRGELLHIASLLELELDFGEEDVEFADRSRLEELLRLTLDKVSRLADSFALGNVMKEGVAVAIAGRPNVGKSTLLNRLAGEERAMVSEIAGTTRDTVEVRRNIGGVIYRFIDTAGLHRTDDRLERMGIERTEQALRKARIILWLTDDEREQGWEQEQKRECKQEQDCNGSPEYRPGISPAGVDDEYHPQILPLNTARPDQKIYRVITKMDLRVQGDMQRTGDGLCASEVNDKVADRSNITGKGVGERVDGVAGDSVGESAGKVAEETASNCKIVGQNAGEIASNSACESDGESANNVAYEDDTIRISAKTGEGIDRLIAALQSTVDASAAYNGNVIVSNQRHYDALCRARKALKATIAALKSDLPTDLLSEEVRQVMHHLGTITGEITSESVLKSIFSEFCIGK